MGNMLTVKMMIFPILFFLMFALIAVLFQIIHQCRGKRDYIGTISVGELNRISRRSLPFFSSIEIPTLNEEKCENGDNNQSSDLKLETSFNDKRKDWRKRNVKFDA